MGRDELEVWAATGTASSVGGIHARVMSAPFPTSSHRNFNVVVL